METSMSFGKTLLFVMLGFVVVSASTAAWASDEGHECKVDADCEHGEHCKDGHCHK
jgi:hypothetical protein